MVLLGGSLPSQGQESETQLREGGRLAGYSPVSREAANFMVQLGLNK